MKSFISIPPALVLALAFNAPASAGDPKDQLASLVRAERDFSKSSVAKGHRDSFIEHFADDVLTFPRGAAPEVGTKSLRAAPADEPTESLTWDPAWADIAASGDFGYTTGPWQYHNKTADGDQVAQGNYLSVWKVQPDGSWKVAVDIGISNPPPPSPVPGFDPRMASPVRAPKGKVDVAAERAALVKAETDFRALADKQGYQSAYLEYASVDARYLRRGMSPAVGREAIRVALAATPEDLTWKPTAADVARSGDLAFTYGSAEAKGGDAASRYMNYVHVWKKQNDGRWKIVADVTVLGAAPAQ